MPAPEFYKDVRHHLRLLARAANAAQATADAALTTAAADAAYLRLDTANGPLTDSLTIEKSSGDAAIFLKADTDNNNETDNPFVRFEQDGNAVACVIGPTGAPGVDAEGNTFTGGVSNYFGIHNLWSSGGVCIGARGAVSLITDGVSVDVVGLANFTSADTPPAALASRLTANMLFVDGKEAIDGNDPWLRLNQNGDFTNGIYTPGMIRADGNFQGDAANDSPGSPAFSWNDDSDCGMYKGGANVIGWATGGTSRMTLGSTGNLVVTGDVTGNSDARLKSDVRLIDNALAKLSMLNGYTFNRDDIEDDRRHAGVIAQEIEIVLPEVVHENEDGIKSVAYGNLSALLIEAVKELSDRVDALHRL